MRVAGKLAVLLASGLVAACDGGAKGTAAPATAAPRASQPASGAAPSSSAPRPAPTGAREPVVLAIVVDQLSTWLAASRFPELPKDGGFGRLVREGTWVKELRYPYAVTDTAPGHATLSTGKMPAESGVFANEVPDEKGERVSILRDPATKLLTPEGVSERPGSSASILRVDTVSDRLRAARPDALVVSVSLKDRGAVLPAGKKPSHVLWYDAKSGAFVTSTAFARAYPPWAASIGSAAANEARRKVPWTVLDPAWISAHAATPDDAPGEGDFDGLGRVFPHVAKTPGSFRATPQSDDALVDLTLAALDAGYDPSRPTLLLVSFSAHDIMSHVFGPDSWEAWDYLKRLDATLVRLLEGVERRVGEAHVLLASDHGAVSMPETQVARKALCGGRDDALERPCKGGHRLAPEGLRDELRAATTKAFGGGTWIAGVGDPYVFLTAEARALGEGKRAALDKVVRDTLARHGEAVADVLDVRMLAATCPGKLSAPGAGIPARAHGAEDVVTLVCRAWSPTIGAGDYYIVPKRGSFFDPDYVPGHGTSHGTPYLYDRTVPLLVRARGRIDAGRTIEGGVDVTAYAALEAALLGLDPTPPKDVLEALRAPPAANTGPTPKK